MADKTYKGITIKFGADTTSLGNALREIDQQAKSVTADLKEIDKGLKLDPKNVELLDKKFRAIGEAVQLSQKRLDALKQAQAEAAEQMKNGAEGAEERYKALETEIQKTENTLAQLKNQAKATSDAVKKELTDSIDKFAGQIKNLSLAVGAVVTALGGLTFSAASSADEINTLSKVTGISTEELQKFSYAANLIDVSVETLRGSLQRLTRNMNGASDESGAAYEAFKALGIEIKDTNGELRNNVDVFYETVDALGEIENATQRDAYAMQIFGRSAQELNPLIIAGSQALKDLGEEADNMGLIFDQETLDNLNEVQDKIDVTKQQLKGAATIIGGELADSFDTLFDGADGLLKMVQQAKEDGTLKEIADGVADAVEILINVLGAAAKFVYEFRNEIAAGVAALIAYKAALSISNIVSALVKTIKYFTVAQEAATGAQTAFNAAASVNPYAVIAAAAAAAVIAIMKFVAAEYEAAAAYGEFFDKVEEDLVKNNEAVRSYDELTDSIKRNSDARQKAAADVEGEFYGYEKLIDELYNLDEQETKTEATKARMKEIIGELNKAIPDLNIQIDNETGKLKTQREEIEKVTAATKEFQLAKAAAANQEVLMQDLASAELSKNKLDREYEQIANARKEKIKELAKKYNLDENISGGDLKHLLSSDKYSNYNNSGVKADLDELEKLDAQLATVTARSSQANDIYNALNEDVKANAELIEQYSEQLAEEAKATEDTTAATEELAGELEEQGDKFEEAINSTYSRRNSMGMYLRPQSSINPRIA